MAGRRRKYADNAAKQRAYRERQRQKATQEALRNARKQDYDQASLYMLRLIRSGRETSARAVMLRALSEMSEEQYAKFYDQLRRPELF